MKLGEHEKTSVGDAWHSVMTNKCQQSCTLLLCLIYAIGIHWTGFSKMLHDYFSIFFILTKAIHHQHIKFKQQHHMVMINDIWLFGVLKWLSTIMYFTDIVYNHALNSYVECCQFLAETLFMKIYYSCWQLAKKSDKGTSSPWALVSDVCPCY